MSNRKPTADTGTMNAVEGADKRVMRLLANPKIKGTMIERLLVDKAAGRLPPEPSLDWGDKLLAPDNVDFVVPGIEPGLCDDGTVVGRVDSTPKRQRKPNVLTLIAQAEKAGKNVASITTPDGTTLTFGEAQPTEASNPWLVDIERATKQ